MSWPEVMIGMVLLAVVVCGFFYPAVALHFLAAGYREMGAPSARDDALPPVTLLRPLKAGVPALRDKLDALVAALRPGDQLVLGVDAGADEERVGADVRTAFPEREIIVVACAAGAALNPKISKLIQMTPHARHGHWILSDSEALIDGAWLDAFRSEWLTSGADALTAGYRFINLATWPQRLDAAAALLVLWPGLAMVRRFGRVNFTLGACTGFRREDVKAVGGWAAFGDFLAEDNRLGAALAKAGRTIRLSMRVATLDSDPLTWRDYWRHQRRVAVTYRVCNPAGFAGMILTNDIVGLGAWVLFAALAAKPVPIAGLMLFLVLLPLTRWRAFRRIGKALRFQFPQLFPVMLAASAVELACWCAAWGDRRVWWAGRRWQVSRDGRLTPLG